MELNSVIRKATDSIYKKISKTIPEIEWAIHAPYIYKINKLKNEIEKFLPQVISTQDIFDTELLIRIEKNGGKIKEIPAKVNEIRPSVSLIYKRIPRTIISLIKLRIIFYKESLKTKNL